MQEQLGVNEPDYGSLWSSRHFSVTEGRVEIPAEPFLQPFLEREIAFLVEERVGENATPEVDLAATEALAVAVEVVDSRIEDWNIRLPDTIADNASPTAGSWSQSLREADLRTVGMLISKDDSQVAEGLGAASLGHPARAVTAQETAYHLPPGHLWWHRGLGEDMSHREALRTPRIMAQS
jgi:2-keto-4-pentenoate hydratase